jgi:DNA-binding MarR family transcriptional regulator
MSDFDILSLLETIQIFERKINLALMYYGLRLPQYRVLSLLHKSGRITVSDLSRRLDVTRATMSVLIAKLRKAGLVECLNNRVDKRSFYIILTEAGSLRLKNAEQAFELMQKSICKSLPAETIQALNQFSLGVRH